MLQPILKINLTSGETSSYNVPPAWQRDFLGGASLAARLLYATLTPELNAFDEHAPLLFLNGPLTGSLGPTVGRFVVCGLSPATGLWAEANCGGFWGPELRMAGYDGLWITGRAKGRVYLWLTAGRLEVRDASGLWGLDTYQVQSSFAAKWESPVRVSQGSAWRARTESSLPESFATTAAPPAAQELGAVMGAKNLKAIAVKGHLKTPLSENEVYKPIRSASNRALRNENESRVLQELGTSGVTDYADYLGSMPKMYYTLGEIDNIDKVSGSTMKETILVGSSACQGCVIACGRVVNLGDGHKRKGPEYETVVGLGPNLLIRDLSAITRLMELCDRYGMDTISTGNTIGCAMHLFDRGIISESDTGGIILKWGDEATVAELIHLTARREGFGELLAQGSRRMAKHFGAEEEAVQVNGLEVAYHDPRGVSGMGLVYATSPRGACHNQSDYFFVEWGQAEEAVGLKFYDRHAGAEKSGNVAIHQNWRTVFNSLVMCIFANVPPQTQVDLINAACDYNLTIADMMQSGERGWTIKRAINNRRGLTRVNDKLPKAFLEPYETGGSAGYVIPFAEMLEAYYAARGWDNVTGWPLKAKLLELNLLDVAEDLY